MSLEPFVDVTEGGSFDVCVSLTSSGSTTLGCTLTVTLNVIDTAKTG